MIYTNCRKATKGQVSSFMVTDALQLLTAQQDEMIPVAQWIQDQKYVYGRIPDLETKMAIAREHIEQGWRTLEEIIAEFRQKT